MSEIDQKLDAILDIESDIKEKTAVVKLPDRKENVETDYRYARENLYNLVERGQDAIDGILELSKETEHPRAYEVAGQLIKTVGETAEKLIGLLGLKEKIEPEKPIAGDAFERRHNIPKYLPDALKRLKVSNELSETLGNDFITLFTEIKQTEHDAYQNVISAWEREHLLLNV